MLSFCYFFYAFVHIQNHPNPKNVQAVRFTPQSKSRNQFTLSPQSDPKAQIFCILETNPRIKIQHYKGTCKTTSKRNFFAAQTFKNNTDLSSSRSWIQILTTNLGPDANGTVTAHRTEAWLGEDKSEANQDGHNRKQPNLFLLFKEYHLSLFCLFKI